MNEYVFTNNNFPDDIYPGKVGRYILNNIANAAGLAPTDGGMCVYTSSTEESPKKANTIKIVCERVLTSNEIDVEIPKLIADFATSITP